MICLNFSLAGWSLVVTGCLSILPAFPEQIDRDGAIEPATPSLTLVHVPVNSGQAANVKEITLTGLRDSGLTLEQLKQETIHLYQEATRTAVNTSTKLEVTYPDKISERPLSEKDDYLPARPEWLTYYLGTMEPIVQLFQEDVKDVRAGVKKRLVPKSTKEAFEPLVAEWDGNIANLNDCLDKLNATISQAKIDNIVIAKQAVVMYEIIERLEMTRRRAFQLMRSAQKEPDMDKVAL